MGPSQLVSTVNCIKEGGTTVFAAAIDKARTTLAANHDPEAQDVIIFATRRRGELRSAPVAERLRSLLEQHLALSDESVRLRRSRRLIRRPRQGLGLWNRIRHPGRRVLGLEVHRHRRRRRLVRHEGRDPVRLPESPAITANVAVKAIASDDTKFFSSPNPGSLTTLFKSIAAELTEGRLLDDDAT